MKPSNPENANKKWTPEDDKFLMEAWETGVSLVAIQQLLGRSPNSISARIIKHLDAARPNQQGELFD